MQKLGQESLSKTEIEDRFAEAIRIYKVYFENEFRLLATIPYFYLDKKLKFKKNVEDIKEYINTGASEKYHKLRSIKTLLIKGNFKSLTNGFDTDIRNAGEGHDSWEIDDRGNIVLNNIHPRTGKIKSIKEVSENELQQIIDECRRTLWAMRVGIHVFLNNNKSLAEQIEEKRNFKLKEIERYFKSFVENDRYMEVLKFQVNEYRDRMKITLKPKPQKLGTTTQFYLASGVYDAVNVEENIEYKYQILGILQFLFRNYFEKDKLPCLELEIYNLDDKCISKMDFNKDELEKLFINEGEERIPIPVSGEYPNAYSGLK